MAQALAQNLERVRARIERARTPESGAARLLAVTKSVAPEVAGQLVALGQLDLAENRFEGLSAKRERLDAEHPDKPLRWHFVGHIQRNKARRIALLADEIHTVDSLPLIETLARVCREERRRPRVYLQLKLTDETTKHGLAPADLPAALAAATAATDALELAGLMTMAPLVDDGAERAALARRTFDALRALAADHADAPWVEGRALLSMGMSGDLEQAVAAGSDWLRIGRALFAEPTGAVVPDGLAG